MLQSQYVHIIVWMLRHRLLIQLHTYIYLVASKSAPAVQVGKLHSESDNGSGALLSSCLSVIYLSCQITDFPIKQIKGDTFSLSHYPVLLS